MFIRVDTLSLFAILVRSNLGSLANFCSLRTARSQDGPVHRAGTGILRSIPTRTQ